MAVVRLAALGLLIAVVTSLSLGATVIVPADLGELARDAEAIVRGRVVAVEAQWTEGRRTIDTLVTLEVDEYLKGGLGGTVTFRVPGGTLGRYRNVVVGAPTFSVGQQVIVFLGTRGPTIPFVLGLNQGLFRLVARDADTWVIPPPVLPGTTGPVVRGSAPRAPSSLTAFASEVRALVKSVP